MQIDVILKYASILLLQHSLLFNNLQEIDNNYVIKTRGSNRLRLYYNICLYCIITVRVSIE